MNTFLNSAEKLASTFAPGPSGPAPAPSPESTSLSNNMVTSDGKELYEVNIGDSIFKKHEKSIDVNSHLRSKPIADNDVYAHQFPLREDELGDLSSLSLNSLTQGASFSYLNFPESKLDKVRNSFSIELDSHSAKELNPYTKQYLKWIKTSLSLTSSEQLSKYYSSDYTRTPLTKSDVPSDLETNYNAIQQILPSGENISTDRASVVTNTINCRRILRSFQLAVILHSHEFLNAQVIISCASLQKSHIYDSFRVQWQQTRQL